MTRAVRWNGEVVRTVVYNRRKGCYALVEWLLIIIDLKSLSTKLTDLIRKSNPNIAHDIGMRSTVFAMREWTRDITKGCTLTFERHVWTLFNTESLLHNVALTLNFGDADKITHLCLIFDPPQPLAGDFDINAM
jgi:hypothetical protein